MITTRTTPPVLQVPSNAPSSIEGVGQFMTVLVQALNNWAAQLFNYLSPLASFSGAGTGVSTSSATGVMAGEAAANGWVLSPSATGKVLVFVSALVSNSVAGNGAQFQIRYGTGTAPGAGSALVGTTLGALVGSPAYPAGGDAAEAVALVSGLKPGTPYWFDIAILSPGGGTASFANTFAVIAEVM